VKSISRRQFVSSATLASAGAFTLSGFAYPFTDSEDAEYVDVETAYGKLRGVREDGVIIYRGVPFAGRISGDRRFRRPEPLEPWTGVREALRLGHPAIQPPKQTYGINEPEPAEDCLVLNIWTPANDNKKRPVMFYNHGGGFATGSGGSVAQDGTNLARNFDVVVVQTNHRLGIMGYLYLDEIAGAEYTGSGNNGMLDIIDGLKWVHQNIEAFGGNPDNVMIFGESGGGAKTSCLYAMPDAASCFNKASIESGPGVRMTPREVADETTSLVLKTLNIAPADWRKLLEMPAADLLAVQMELSKMATPHVAPGKSRGIGGARPGGFGPVVDGGALPAHPFDPVAPAISKNKPLLVGWNEDEYNFFAMVSGDVSAYKLDEDGLRKKLESQYGKDTDRIIDTYRKSRPNAAPTSIYVEIASVTFMGLGSIEIAEKKCEQKGAPAYLYNFGYKSEVKIPHTDYAIGTPHAMDIQFKFNNVVPSDNPQSGKGMAGNRSERFKASRNFAELWATFARTGVPAAVGQPAWPPYDLIKRPTLRIDSTCEVIYDRNRSERELWQSLGYMG
jgi:para-nitrobenzyl esterase